MIIEIYNVLKSEGFDVKIGNGIIISKNGFKCSINGNKFIEMCEILSKDSLVENNISTHDTKRTHSESE